MPETSPIPTDSQTQSSNRDPLGPPPRAVNAHYSDPLDLIWLHCAREIGWTVVRSPDVYASFDGRNTLLLGRQVDLDPDDSLAQLIFHEICHALVEGPSAWALPDWGLENTDTRDLHREHAVHRLQAHLAGCHGLRRLFAVTTDWRPYWDSLPVDPLAGDADPAIPLALAALHLLPSTPMAKPLDAALRRTAAVATIVGPLASPDCIWSSPELPP